jgi:large subunit ribosomal protein L23
MEFYEIIKRPIISEKATGQHEKNVYAFEVAKKANKIQVAKAIQDMYGVTVEEVRTMVCRGKNITRFTKKGVAKGNTGSWKKAMVKLVAGETIDIFANTAAERTTEAAN